MIKDWQFVFRQTYDLSDVESVAIPLTLTAPYLIVQAQSDEYRRQLGVLHQNLFLDGFGEVQGENFGVINGYQMFRPLFTANSYRLVFEPTFRVGNLQISLWTGYQLLPSDLEFLSSMSLVNPSRFNFYLPTSSNVTPTAVAAATASTTLLAANQNRKGATFWNNSTATLYLEIGAGASSNAFAARLEAQGYYELPYGYTGVISGAWSEANGNCLVRELV